MIIRDILLILLVEMIRTANENEHFLNQKIKKNLKRFCLFLQKEECETKGRDWYDGRCANGLAK